MDESIIIAITTGLVQMFKTIGVSTKYAPICSLICSTVLVALIGYNFMPINKIIVTGLICGLSACGLYSGAKTILRSDDSANK